MTISNICLRAVSLYPFDEEQFDFLRKSNTRVTRHKKNLQSARLRQQVKNVMEKRGFCWQRIMGSSKIFTNRVKVAHIMAECYGGM
jgi:hypothetical protein